MTLLDADWIARLRARAAQPPLQARDRLLLGTSGVEIGSIDPVLAARIAAAGLPLEGGARGWRLTGPPDASLARIAGWLDANRVSSRWRGELLGVIDPQGGKVAQVERSASRALGLTTCAVHLVGRTAGGDVWVQQRAYDKSTDPGLWDTLMGGLVTADESIADTLARETMEEAGLELKELNDIRPCGRVTVRRPVVDGYMIEHIDVFEALVPEGVVPANRDGEVERFERLGPAALLQRLQAEAFTLEAALVLVSWLQQREAPAPSP